MKRIIIVGAAGFLVGSCSGQDSSGQRAEENSCMKAVIDQQGATEDNFAQQRNKAAKEGKSTTEITIARRRAIESSCLDLAKCFDQKDLAKSNIFHACLEDAGR